MAILYLVYSKHTLLQISFKTCFLKEVKMILEMTLYFYKLLEGEFVVNLKNISTNIIVNFLLLGS